MSGRWGTYFSEASREASAFYSYAEKGVATANHSPLGG